MATRTLSARVAKLEKTVAELVARRLPPTSPEELRQPGRDDWQKVVGMFDVDEMMKRIDERGAAIRRAERRKARRG